VEVGITHAHAHAPSLFAPIYHAVIGFNDNKTKTVRRRCRGGCGVVYAPLTLKISRVVLLFMRMRTLV
jgi:hypothetical protein